MKLIPKIQCANISMDVTSNLITIENGLFLYTPIPLNSHQDVFEFWQFVSFKRTEKVDRLVIIGVEKYLQ